MVAKEEVSVNVKTKNSFKYDYFRGFLLCLSKKDNKQISVRTKLSVDERMIKSCLEKLHDLCYLMIPQT